MLFTDRNFFIFLGATFVLCYLPIGSAVWQISVLLVASVVFYAWSQPYLLALLFFSAILSTVTSYLVERSQRCATRRLWAILGVLANVLVLSFFKYGRLLFATFIGAPSLQEGVATRLLALPLPIGISFYTFHGISLVIDVFRAGGSTGLRSPLGQMGGFIRHSWRTFFYLTFFPQLIAGPIVKAKDFYPQMSFKKIEDIDWYRVAQDLITGFFLKSVVADNLALQTGGLQAPYFIYASSLDLVSMLFAYSIQIFADFAGYSLIAMGLARLFGYWLPDNFRFPYIAQTFSEFWTRWHMSLSAWLRDYIYYPLGGNRKGVGRTYFNLLFVMVLGGLWHGAGWSYAGWGLWHGTALVIERAFRDSRFYSWRSPIAGFVRWAIVFVTITIGWIFFLNPHFADVLQFAKVLWINRRMRFSLSSPFFMMIYVCPVIAYHALYKLRATGNGFFSPLWSAYGRSGLLSTMLASIIVEAGNPNPFIYFQF